MKNKYLLKFILSCLLVFLLVGCSDNSTSKGGNTSNSSTGNITSSSVSTKPVERIDYVSQTKIASSDWKNKSFLSDGVGQVTLYKTVDGDTAHFTDGNKIIQVRFNGVNTPESTGKIEPWGHAASEFTKENLVNAKTIIIETDPNENNGGPIADSTGNRYLAWVWISDKPISEEDGSTLKLLNLMLVDGSYSATKGISGSYYSQVFVNCDLQAQNDKLRIWSKDPDPDFYYGSAINTNIKDICQNQDEYLGKRVVVEGIVTRTLGLNVYIQEFYDDDETGISETYGLYIFSNYTEYRTLFVRGYRLRVVGVVSEYPANSGHIQLVDVSYDKYFPDEEKDMKLISKNNAYEALEISPSEALTKKYYCVLVKFYNVTVTGGYGGRAEGNDTNAMTLYAVDGNGDKFNIRIDGSTFIKDKDGNTIESYKYFVGLNFDISGMVGYYESVSGNKTYQLMLVTTSDLIYL